jgi:hypothetical protein
MQFSNHADGLWRQPMPDYDFSDLQAHVAHVANAKGWTDRETITALLACIDAMAGYTMTNAGFAEVLLECADLEREDRPAT